MTYEEILYDVADGVATITFNRPERLNAVTPTMSGEIHAAVTAATKDAAVRVIVLTGAGRGFCAGADTARLSQRARGEERATSPLPDTGAIEGGLDLPKGFDSKYTYLPTASKPIIAAINGAAAGVGLVMALYADVRFAAESAKMTSAFAKRGLVAEYASAWILPRIVGPSKAMDLLCTARIVQGKEAHQMGLVDYVYPDGELMDAVYAYAKSLAHDVSPRSVRIIKGLVYNSLEQSMAEAVEVSAVETAASGTCEDFKEGVAAYNEKRQPNFTGR